MRERNQTTLVLTKKAQEVKDDLAPIFGLKNILSAGLVLFGQLTDAQQKAAIAAAGDKKVVEGTSTPPSQPITLHEALHRMVERMKAKQTVEGNIVKIVRRDEKTWEELNRLVESQTEPTKKRKMR